MLFKTDCEGRKTATAMHCARTEDAWETMGVVPTRMVKLQTQDWRLMSLWGDGLQTFDKDAHSAQDVPVHTIDVTKTSREHRPLDRTPV
eukprot:4825081-Amphidinium_carterae.1